MTKSLLAPSLLSADFSNLDAEIAKIQAVPDSIIHFDVMDGHFVPEISFGEVVLRSIRPKSQKIFDVHLMTENPEKRFESFAKAGADWITFHAECCEDFSKTIFSVKNLGVKCGIAIKPQTSIQKIQGVLGYADLILVMLVNPGFGGQKCIPECVEKACEIKKICKKNGFQTLVSVDGGVNAQNLQQIVQTGVDVIVSGSAFFSGKLGWKNV